MKPRSRPGLQLTFVLVLVAVSGFCSLVYQVIWDRALRYDFGGDIISSAIVAATFLLGLGIGAFLFSRVERRPFVVYALIETGTGLYALASYWIISKISLLLASVLSYSIGTVDGVRAITILGCILAVLPPTILMGGTLPLMFRCFVQTETYSPRQAGLIYGVNTLGAALGILAVPYVLLNQVTMPAALIMVGCINLALGTVIYVWGCRMTWSPAPSLKSTVRLPVFPAAIAFLSGFIVIAVEVSLIRSFAANHPSSPYSFPLVLFLYLLALALASMLLTKFRDYSDQASVRRIGFLFCAGMMGMMAQVFFREFTPYLQDAPIPDRIEYVDYVLYAPLIVLVPLAIGAAFPLTLRLVTPRSGNLPAVTGSLYLINSIGAFAGAMWLQFAAIPLIGTRGALYILYAVGVVAGLYCLYRSNAFASARARVLFGIAVLIAVPLLLPPSAWERYIFGLVRSDMDAVEGMTGVVTVEWGADAVPLYNPGRWLKAVIRINGNLMGLYPDHPKHMRLAGIALSHEPHTDTLVLGLGSGAMVRELAKDPELHRLDVVDWSRELPVILREPREHAMLEGEIENPKVHLYSADARVAVAVYPSNTFDTVIDNLAVLGWLGSTGLKSDTYFRQVARILKPDGIYVLDANWSPDSRPAVLAALFEDFKYVDEVRCANVVVASRSPIVFDPTHTEAIFASRKAVITQFYPYCHSFDTELTADNRDTFKTVRPVTDDYLVWEYTQHPADFIVQTMRSTAGRLRHELMSILHSAHAAVLSAIG